MSKLKADIHDLKTGVFVRYGGLSPVKQTGYTTDPECDYHSPPARKGIYAFPFGQIELFLLGGDWGKINKKGTANRFVYLRDKDGNIITDEHKDFEKLSENDNYWEAKIKLKEGATPDEEGDYWYYDYVRALTTHVSPRQFKHSGEIWHHLKESVPTDKILKEKGEWIKTSMETYKKAYKKNYHIQKTQMMEMDGKASNRNPLSFFSKDHLEVFIERVK